MNEPLFLFQKKRPNHLSFQNLIKNLTLNMGILLWYTSK
jgi:hypothetical protein